MYVGKILKRLRRMRLLAQANWYNLRWLSFLPMAVAELSAASFDKFDGEWFISVNGA